MNAMDWWSEENVVSAGCHINDVMNMAMLPNKNCVVSAGCHINDVMNCQCVL